MNMNYDNSQGVKVQAATDNVNDVPKLPRTPFDLSRVVGFNGLFGALMPFDLIPMAPNEDVEISYDVTALTRNPTVRQIMNGCTIYIHTYYNKCSDLWDGWNAFIKGSYNGESNLTIPRLYPAIKWSQNSTSMPEGGPTFYPVSSAEMKMGNETDFTTLVPFAPSSYMGLPIGFKPIDVATEPHMAEKNNWIMPRSLEKYGTGFRYVKRENAAAILYNGNETKKWCVNALPFVMYNKIYRDYYTRADILNKNPNWYPEDVAEFRLHQSKVMEDVFENSGKYANAMDGGIWGFDQFTGHTNPLNDYVFGIVPSTMGSKESTQTVKRYQPAFLNIMHYRLYRGDYFTSASPYPDLLNGNKDAVVGDAIATTESEVMGSIELPDNVFDTDMTMSNDLKPYVLYRENNPTHNALIDGGYAGPKGNGEMDATRRKVIRGLVSKAKINGKIKGNLLMSIRQGLLAEKMLIRKVKSEGSYNKTLYQSFKENARVDEFKPIYIGGASYPVNWSSVVAQNETDQNTLGKTNSIGRVSSSGYIGKFHSNDWGYVMSIMSIVPDMFYKSEGIEYFWNEKTKDDVYFPESNNLEPEPILNREITLKGDSDGVFGWVNVNEKRKTRRNRIVGLGSLDDEPFDRAQYMVKEHWGDPEPALNLHQLSMIDIDMTPFTNKYEPPFDVVVGCNVEKISTMPFKPDTTGLNVEY